MVYFFASFAEAITAAKVAAEVRAPRTLPNVLFIHPQPAGNYLEVFVPSAGFPQKIYVPLLVEVTISILPSPFRSTASTSDPAPERLCINCGISSAPPGALGLRTVLNQ